MYLPFFLTTGVVLGTTAGLGTVVCACGAGAGAGARDPPGGPGETRTAFLKDTFRACANCVCRVCCACGAGLATAGCGGGGALALLFGAAWKDC